MQISTSRSNSKKTMIDMLVETGFSKERATNLYNKYKTWDKLDKLQEYIDAKMSINAKYDSYPLRDM